jgi:uncharacterized protein YndB with AHSA1/START domain
MKNSLLFDFTVDKATNTIAIRRQFAANQSLVWDAFTKKDLLDQWWAPAPWLSKTSHMNFEVGGRRVYAMCGPEGEEHWALQTFSSITAISNFQFDDFFADPQGNADLSMPTMYWNLDFSPSGDSALVNITVKFKTLDHLQQIIQMGFKEGFEQALEQLDSVLIKKIKYEKHVIIG